MGMEDNDEEDRPFADEEVRAEMPERVSRLPMFRQDIWLRAFNKALEETGDRNQAEAIALAEALEGLHEAEEEVTPHHRESRE